VPGANRRRAERSDVPGHWEATLHRDDAQQVTVRVENVAPGGIGLLLPAPGRALAQGERLTLTVRAPGREFTRVVVVRWLRVDGGLARCGAAYLEQGRCEAGGPRLALDQVRVDPSCALKVPGQVALRRGVLPLVELDGTVHVACTDCEDDAALAVVERLLKAPVRPWAVDATELGRLIQTVYGESPMLAAAQAPRPGTRDAGALTDELLHAAYLRGASDIHVDPGRQGMQIRLRVDGQLEHYAALPFELHAEVMSRLKVMSGLDIAEKRAPQDGRFTQTFADGGRRVDIRVATLPTKYGERMTLRLLALQTEALTLDRLGLDPGQRQALEACLRRSQGLMIMTGPTGSGKTTTLYAAIRMLLTERSANIMTIEDPIEYAIDGVAQCEVDTADKVSFHKALRSILRHDPDVIMVGEIRDRETADVALKAALTGHLVLGTLHTNSAAATVTRLRDMGVAPYLVAATLRVAVAQRLVRRLCPHCRAPRPLALREALAIGQPELAGQPVHEPVGCVYCAGRGYAGRLGLYELLELDAEAAAAIAEGLSEAGLVERARRSGDASLLDDAVAKLLSGDTSAAEVLRVATSW
jgi:type IV pilus assembly protein PilB